jgi:hypothetical protein
MIKWIEKKLYNFVKKYPPIKNILRDLYQLINIILLKPDKLKIESDYIIKEYSFFGFHDKTPFSYDNKLLLTHKIHENQKWGLPNKNNYISIGYYHGNNYESYNEIDRTNAWNYQQGSMLQWLNKKEIIYNFYDIKKNKHISKIYDICERIYKEIDNPIGAVSPSGEYAVGYSFERLRVGMKGYGYANGADPDKNRNIPIHGLYIVDLKNNTTKEIITVNELLKTTDDLVGFHFFTHVQFSPDSKQIIFFHRIKKGNKRLITNMYSLNIYNNKLYKFPTTGMVSHVFWKNNYQVIGYVNINNKDGYFLFDIVKDTYTELFFNDNRVDGHPHYSNTKDTLLFDTYPNNQRIQKLFQYDFNTRLTQDLAEFYSPLKFKNHMRCDLHPRYSRDGSLVSVDSAHIGKRSTMIIFLEGEKNEEN